MTTPTPTQDTLPVEVLPFDGINTTLLANTTASVLEAVTYRDLIIVDAKLIFTTLAIIFAAAHGSLRRPPSAAPPQKKGSKKTEDERFAQGLMPSDAILFPLLASVVLIGLYYLIQWLQDPEILNKFLRWYMSIAAVASLTVLYGDGLQVLTSFMFPRYWRDRNGALVHVHPRLPGKVVRVPPNDTRGLSRLLESAPNEALPGHLSEINLPDTINKTIWQTRLLFTNEWRVHLEADGIGNESVDVKFNQAIGLVLALATSLAYQWTKSTWLQNLMGNGFCYGALMLLSPTTFTTGTLVHFGLFFYDIGMVFFT
jgi:minor histocompatibility antigen H13